MLTSVGTIAMPCAANCSMVAGSRPVACSMQSVPAAAKSCSDSSPKQWAVTRAPSSCAAAMASLRTSAGQHGVEVPGVAVDPVADELDPAVAGPGLEAHPLDQLVGLHLPGVVADVAPGAGDVAAGADDLGQVVALVDPPRVRRASRRRGSAGCRRRGRPAPAARPSRRSTAPWASRPTWQCASTRPGSTQPRRVCTSAPAADGRSNVEPPADHPRLGTHVVGSDQDLAHQVQHRCRHVRDPTEQPAPAARARGRPHPAPGQPAAGRSASRCVRAARSSWARTRVSRAMP